MIYQLGWATLPGLRGLSVVEFRATPTATPDMEKGVAIEFANDAGRDSLPVFRFGSRDGERSRVGVDRGLRERG